MKRVIHGACLFFGVLLLAGGLCGCLDHEQTLVFSKDGSVVVSYLYVFPANQRQTLLNAQAVIDQWQEGGEAESPAAMLNSFLNEEAVKNYFSARPDVELRHYKQTTEQGACRVQIIVLGRDATAAVNSGIFGAFRMRREEGLTNFSAELPITPSLWDPQRLAHLRTLLAGSRLKLSVITPTPIQQCSQSRHEKNSASWSFAAQAQTGQHEEADLFAAPPAMSVSW